MSKHLNTISPICTRCILEASHSSHPAMTRPIGTAQNLVENLESRNICV
jgi:hypothetical protein